MIGRVDARGYRRAATAPAGWNPKDTHFAVAVSTDAGTLVQHGLLARAARLLALPLGLADLLNAPRAAPVDRRDLPCLAAV